MFREHSFMVLSVESLFVQDVGLGLLYGAIVTTGVCDIGPRTERFIGAYIEQANT